MAFTTFIFGNGLGRAVDQYFDLSLGINRVWNDSSDLKLTEAVKKSIISCLPDQRAQKPLMPSSEAQLLLLHEVTNFCRRLKEVEPDDPRWLTDEFRKLPEAIDEFVAKVAFSFHCFDSERLPEEYHCFIKGLCKYIRKWPTHLATLNYDNLLYQPLIEDGILAGYRGHLIDGFLSDGFDKDNLIRKSFNRKKLGWYLHLHGSPLFYIDGHGKTKKYSQAVLENSFYRQIFRKRHVVLCHAKDKPQVIADSHLLSCYWRYFSKALKQSNVLYVIGYGGGDEHLNKEISSWVEFNMGQSRESELKILEWKDPRYSNDDRKEFWAKTFSTEEFKVSKDKIKVKRLLNILHLNWDNEID